MAKQLNQLTAKEFGKLFPIIISDYNPGWVELFQKEKEIIERVLGPEIIIRVEHIGSTAIPNLKAKPTIDILLEIRHNKRIEEKIIKGLTCLGYHYIPKPENPAPNMMFVKGYTDEGFKGQAFHVHVRYSGDWDELYFRDYLINNPATAKEYSKLKEKLAVEYKNDRDAYTEAKTEFIRTVMEKARKKLNKDLNDLPVKLNRKSKR